MKTLSIFQLIESLSLIGGMTKIIGSGERKLIFGEKGERIKIEVCLSNLGQRRNFFIIMVL